MRRQIFSTKIFALIIITLLFGVGTPVVLAQHEGHDMPAPRKAKPKPQPKPRVQPTKKKQAATQTKSKQTSADTLDEAEAVEPAQPATPQPAPEPSASPEAPSGVHKHVTETPTVAAPPPAAPAEKGLTPTGPQPSSSTEAAQPAAPHKHDMGNTSGAATGAQPAAGSDPEGMKGMVHPPTSVGASAPAHVSHPMMMMSGEQMSIRVGARDYNWLPMGQMGSGTSWQPSTTPMYMWSKVTNDWLLFIHGEAKIGVNAQGGPRGVTKFESQNWIMPMAFRRVGKGTLQLRGMFSLEPLTFSGAGSPQLFQTGESYKGQPIRDAQHPHDLFMELSATYTLPLGERGTWFTYVGFPGEPSLGPTAFMHRWSASENPSAPLAHHLQDSTHISFGVVSTGFTYRWFKLEGSLFNGQEPGENRYNFEFNPWNSRAVRLSVAPAENWSMQWSYGLLKNPEPLNPGDVRRMTASVSYNKPFEHGNWATSLIWGRNAENHGHDKAKLNSYLVESTVNFLRKNYLYTRLELVDKTELLSDDDLHLLGITDHHSVFRIGAYTFGAARDVWNTDKVALAIGGDFTFYSKPDVLNPVYGDNPTSYKLFIRIRPGKMSMTGEHRGNHAQP